MGRILGIDYGSKKLGLAMSDPLRIISSPHAVYPNGSDLMERLKRLCDEYQVDLIVLGLPLSDKYKEAENRCREFGARLEAELGLKVEYQDETLSTLKAENHLRSMGIAKEKIKGQIDKYAAQKILEDYLKSI